MAVTSFGFALLFLALLLLAARMRAIPASWLRMMLPTHLLVMLHLLIHRMRSVSSISVFSHFAGMRFGLVSYNIFSVSVIFARMFVPVIIGPVLVAVFLKISCSLALMFGNVSGFVLSLPRASSCCSSNALCAFAVAVALIK